MQKKVSLKDVANYLGVSTALVSYVVNNKEKEARVSEEMAKKIRKAIATLNYQPNQIAKSLKRGKTYTIGLIVADISNPFFSSIARIIEDEAEKRGYVVIFGSSDENAEKSQKLMNVLMNRQVDAFIIAPAENTLSQIKELKKRNIPFVLVDRYFTGFEADSVHTDNFQAAFDGVTHLISQGHKRIAMIAYDIKLPHMLERVKGYREALRSSGIRLKKQWLQLASHANIQNDVSEAMERLLQPEEQIDAFIFATNTLAAEGLKKIIEHKGKLPEQVALISFDQSDAFDFFYSPISYVNQPIEEIDKQAVDLLIDRINHPSRKTASRQLRAKLVVRASSATRKS